LDHISGLQNGYSSKILAMPGRQQSMRTLGRTSFDLMLPALGIKLALVEDEVVTSRLRSRLDVQTRDEAQVRSASIKASKNSPPGLRSVFMHAIARLGGYARASKLSPERRSSIARRAAKARWRRVREEGR
jgi:hypothetical protein